MKNQKIPQSGWTSLLLNDITESPPSLDGLASEVDSPHPGNCDWLRLCPDKGWVKKYFP